MVDTNNDEARMLLGRWLFNFQVLIQRRRKTIESFEAIIIELNKMTFGTNVAKIVGSLVSISGGILSVVGGVLAVLTFGAATPILVTGIIISTAGGVTAGGASIAEIVINKKKSKEIAETFQKDNEIAEELNQSRERLREASTQMTCCPGIREVIENCRIAGQAGRSAASVIGAVLKVTDEFTGIFAKVVVRVGPKVVHGLGIAVGAVVILFDAGQIIFSSISLHKGSKSEIAKGIQDKIKVLKADLIEKEGILDQLRGDDLDGSIFNLE